MSGNLWPGAFHQLGIIAQEQRDFPRAADFYLKALKVFANTDDLHNVMIAIRNYARLLHEAEASERSRLREKWAMCMDEEWTNILEQMEAELYGADS